MQPNSKLNKFLPLIISISIVIGMFVGRIFTESYPWKHSSNKLTNILNLINDKYVDTVNVDSILENSFPDIIAQLDPHSSYISAKDLQSTNEELDGSFSGVGISFTIMNDTISIIEVISGGPSEKVGILAGDRIIKINNDNVAGASITNEKVMSLLRGQKGSKVSIEIKRNSSLNNLTFDITRGEIPVNSIDASYIIKPQIGFIKINKFCRSLIFKIV